MTMACLKWTRRELAAMLNKLGLLTQGNAELLPFAWNMFKREMNQEISERENHVASYRPTNLSIENVKIY
jgi:uncharacterized protein (DUF2235 family)